MYLSLCQNKHIYFCVIANACIFVSKPTNISVFTRRSILCVSNSISTRFRHPQGKLPSLVLVRKTYPKWRKSKYRRSACVCVCLYVCVCVCLFTCAWVTYIVWGGCQSEYQDSWKCACINFCRGVYISRALRQK